MKELSSLVTAIAEVGEKHPLSPPIAEVDAFRHFFTRRGKLARASLDAQDGCCTHRELLLRMLLLNAVLDQGPDIEGVREMMVKVINHFYQNEIRIFHTPLDFFREINVSVEELQNAHGAVKASRASQWAADNQSTPGKYNLYMDNTKQTLNYAVFRWGVPLVLPYLLSKNDPDNSATALSDYLENYASAEIMSTQLKDHETYGFGKAIGDKACHLFAKWMVSSFQLCTKTDDRGWGEYSYEVPFDSNAGRVLWRTGYFLRLATEEEFIKMGVVQKGQGKGGAHYIRVTKMRGMRVSAEVPADIRSTYVDLCINHLKSHKKAPLKTEIQKMQHPLLFQEKAKVSAFDDGLIAIGRNYCLNHSEPNCRQCPINRHCEGYQSKRALITDYRT